VAFPSYNSLTNMNSLQRASGLILLCSALAASAQVATQQPVTADSTWQALLSFTSQSSTGGQPQTLSQEITQLQQEAQQAKTFYYICGRSSGGYR